jgi:1,4-dihydroxy-2-naphthoate octaprenyltransferase
MMRFIIEVYKEVWRILPYILAVFATLLMIIGPVIGLLVLCTAVSFWWLLLFLLAPLWIIAIQWMANIANYTGDRVGMR